MLTVLLTWPERIVIGVILLAAGAALGIPALRGFRSAGTHVEPWKPSTALVTDGIFGWLRNPMYVGLTLLLAGLSVAARLRLDAGDDDRFRRWSIHFGVVKREERYLEAKFGDAYRAYKARVPRYGWPLELTRTNCARLSGLRPFASARA